MAKMKIKKKNANLLFISSNIIPVIKMTMKSILLSLCLLVNTLT